MAKKDEIKKIQEKTRILKKIISLLIENKFQKKLKKC